MVYVFSKIFASSILQYSLILFRNAPKFGIAHALSLGLGPWMAVEIPEMIERGTITKP